jgi:hypothetical protein
MTRFQRDFVNYARDAGVRDIHLVHGGKHDRLIGAYAGRLICLIVPATPSDYRASRNARAFLDRALRRAEAGGRYERRT